MYCTFLVIYMSPSCVYREVMWPCHVSKIYDVFVKDGTKCVCV